MSVNATYEGVVRLPWSLAMISTRSAGAGARGKGLKKELEDGQTFEQARSAPTILPHAHTAVKGRSQTCRAGQDKTGEQWRRGDQSLNTKSCRQHAPVGGAEINANLCTGQGQGGWARA